jgi:uncharacterized membrane protein YeaQ/YmgE (transglycosylase-associated protein family)
MLDILAWVFFGLLAGVIAKVILPGRDPGGVIVTILIGIVGSLIGGFIGRAVMGYGRIDETGDLSRPGFLMSLALAVLGSLVLLAGYRLVKGRRLTA